MNKIGGKRGWKAGMIPGKYTMFIKKYEGLPLHTMCVIL